ncbi:MAG TPA: hypothetical protein VD813_01445 [Pseudonocardia sp.]|nr:hypothetical protein [Pseudonocardia sp.]
MPGYRCGDVFALPLPAGQAALGRVVLDVGRQCVASGLVDAGSPLDTFGGEPSYRLRPGS